MKSSFFFVALLAMLALGACKSEPEAEAGDGNKTDASSKPAAQSQEDVIGIVPYEGGVLSEQSLNLLDALSSGYWYVHAYLTFKDRKENFEKHKGRWYQFTRDGHITAGKWKEAVTQGTWTYYPQKAILTIRTEDPSYTGEFTIKAATDFSVMIWVGTETYQQTDVQAKLENYLQLMDTLP
ncbi:MAG TPA: hypothetical protein ENJ88_01030 [Phaeodactylibacter sp.]|nr:hypothetical protein [Phaeodactylibacter sp.]